MSRSLLIVALAWCGVLPRAVSVAGEVTPIDVASQAAPVFDVYTSEDGLSPEIYSAVGIDADGYVWAGSASSLSRFDGYRWREYPVPGAGSLVRDFQLDDQGRFWAVFEGDGVAVLDPGGQWRLVQDLPGMRSFSEQVGPDGEREFWLAYAHGLARLVDGRWVPDPANGEWTRDGMASARTEQLMGRPLQWLARYNQGGLWYREVRGAGRFGPWREATIAGLADMALNNLQRSVSARGEELWLTSYATGLARLSADGFDVWRAFDSCSARFHAGPQPEPLADGSCRPASLPTEAMYSAEVTYDPDGTRSLWLSTRAGLTRFQGERVIVYDRTNGLPSNAIRGLGKQVVDGVDVIWLATEAGVARAPITESPWRTVSLLGARENGAMGLLLEPDGRGGQRLWTGSSQRGLAMFEQGQWRYFDRDKGQLPSNNVRDLWRVTGPDGDTWRLIAFSDDGLYRIHDDFRFERIPLPFDDRVGVFVDEVLDRTQDGRRELWVATFGSGVLRFREGIWQQFDLPGMDETERVFDLVQQVGPDGRAWLWAAGAGGLARFDGQGWRATELDLEQRPTFSSAYLVDRLGRTELWLGTVRQGVVRLDVSDPEAPRRLEDASWPDAPDPTVYSVLSDSRDRLYICTNNGVQRLTPRGDSYNSEVFRRVDGLIHDECNSNSQFIDAQDRYWVGTLGGLSLFDPRQGVADADRTANAGEKTIFLTDVAFDGDVLTRPLPEIIEVPAGVRELRVAFALLAGLRESESRYRTRLIGYEETWSEWTSQPSRYFTDLAPGSYRLMIEGMDYAGIAGDPLSIELRVAPFWWQRASVQGLAVVLLVTLLIAGVHFYNRGVRQREQLLNRMIGERTRELRDANERLTRLSYRDPLTQLANRRRLMKTLKLEMARARERGHALGLIIVDVDHFKPYNDTYGHVAGDAALSAIASALVQATRKRDLVARLGGEEFACLVVDTDLATVEGIAERMRALVAALSPRELGNEQDRLTVSAGVLVRVPSDDDDLSSFLTDCDAALYRAKHDGRNRVRVFEGRRTQA